MILDSCVTSDGTVAMMGEAPIASVALAESEAEKEEASMCRWHGSLPRVDVRTVCDDDISELLIEAHGSRE